MTVMGGERRRPLHVRISEDLLTGRLTAEDRLSEHALSERYGVSRTPVREALVRLEQDGLIERRGTTARLRERSAEEINDIYRARTWLERAIAEDAAQRCGELDLLRMQDALDAEDRLDPATATPEELMAANRAFHDALALAAHNAALQDLQDRLTMQVARLPATTLSAPGRWATAHQQHEEILVHVRAGDAAAAGEMARRHMADARDIRLALSLRPPRR
ncbi:GntR family transcriptional regulator [Pseudonocardia kunmingensis]|uniref:GntR family transcriptional regulator n=1 Tax=Pseudonocardia kunmingensis TaxID=630975 RepID=A0A543DPN1_9PSEU|nr:GntR family transcriptional regulator [Pseudonocardia kunmingensis]TQM11287.1 GntR family transcriptional regulator [Pseudonocardia kunmingensis]